MCGIVGFFGEKIISLDSAGAAIKHRGPDMQGIKYSKNWGVAFQRLSINDLSEAGMQPFEYDGVFVYLNGEIYNFKELKEEHKDEFKCKSGSDVEIIPYLFRKYGINFLNKLNGMFAIVILDAKCNKYYLIRDRFGQKPLFYKEESKNFIFSSEIKALKQISVLEPDKTNLAINFFCNYLPQPLSLYKDVFGVNPGCYIEYCDGDFKEIRWYNPTIKPLEISFDEIRDNFIKLYKDSINLRLRSDVPVGVYLSGGLDSTSIAKFAKELSGENFKSFTADIKDKFSFENNNTDVEIPIKICKDLGLENFILPIDFDYYNKNMIKFIKNYDEIFVNSGVLVFYALSKISRENDVKVILSGVGGDEIFGGYPWQSLMRKIPKFILKNNLLSDLFYNERLCNILGLINPKLVTAYKLVAAPDIWHSESLAGRMFSTFMEDVSGKVHERIRKYSRIYFMKSQEIIGDDIYNQVNFANYFTVTGSQNYMADMGSMFNSIENRSPLLDFRLVELMMSIPDNTKIENGQKGLMRDILKGYMPDYVLEGKKSGPGMPINVWLNDEAIKGKLDLFLDKNLHFVKDYLSVSLYDNIKKNKDILYSSKSMPLFAVINFLIWCKLNIENISVSNDIYLTEFLEL